jgi:hypothetical protein
MDMKKNLLISSIVAVGLMYGCQSSSTSVASGSSSDSGADLPAPTVSAKILPDGWYARATVTAITPEGKIYKHTTAGVFGELKDSNDAQDRHDIEAMHSGVVQILFVNEDIEADKKYYSDYRELNDTKKESWTLVVSNISGENITDADIKLDISSIYDVFTIDNRYVEKVSDDQSKLQKMTLIDLDNNQTYSIDELKDINKLSMDGKKDRYFRLVLGDVAESDKTLPKLTKSLRMSKQVTQVSKDADTFGLPPQI